MQVIVQRRVNSVAPFIRRMRALRWALCRTSLGEGVVGARNVAARNTALASNLDEAVKSRVDSGKGKRRVQCSKLRAAVGHALDNALDCVRDQSNVHKGGNSVKGQRENVKEQSLWQGAQVSQFFHLALREGHLNRESTLLCIRIEI